jgi:hypothetical protein
LVASLRQRNRITRADEQQRFLERECRRDALTPVFEEAHARRTLPVAGEARKRAALDYLGVARCARRGIRGNPWAHAQGYGERFTVQL